eukprot:gene8165-5881_t
MEYGGGTVLPPVASEEVEDVLLANDSSGPIRGVYIRAPAILNAEECVEVIASLEAKPHVSATAEVLKVAASSDGKMVMTANGPVRVIVAVQQGKGFSSRAHSGPQMTPVRPATTLIICHMCANPQ